MFFGDLLGIFFRPQIDRPQRIALAFKAADISL